MVAKCLSCEHDGGGERGRRAGWLLATLRYEEYGE
jgi:hypothetical protein